MKKSRMLTWLTVLLYIVSALGAAAFADEGAGLPEDLNTVIEAPGELAPQQEHEAQHPEESADPDDGSDGSHTPDASPERKDEPEYWLDIDEPSDWTGGLDADGNPILYRVLFINPEGQILLDYEAAAGTPVEDPQLNPTMRGHAFSHWYPVGTNPNMYFEFDQPLTGDLTLAAFFRRIPAAKTAAADPAPAEQPAEEAGVNDADPEDVNTEEENPENADPEDGNPENEVPGDGELWDEEPEDGGDLPPIRVKITSDAGATVHLGDKVTLTANVEDQPEGETFSVWRYDAGQGWVVAATDTQTHSFDVDEDSYHWRWEYKITVIVGAAD
ncbi:MAG: hypothetical protein FWF86_00205 [Clostridia bacterium]|nr:hypothetical protein [Clostridia bacterium]